MSARLALVTGAGGGIGAGVVALLVERGYRVLAVDRDESALARLVDVHGDAVEAIPHDATRRSDVDALVARISGDWADTLEVLVCNAGIIVPGDAADIAATAHRAQLDVMLDSPIQLLSAGAAVMRERGRGHLLATVSMGGVLSLPGSATYSAAKFGLRAFLAALHAEVRGAGVAVSGIYPSGVDTPMLRHEARHGGSMLNFVGTVYEVEDVVRSYARALDTGRLEVYLPYLDSIGARVLGSIPTAGNRLLPVLERLGRRGHRRYLARIERSQPDVVPTT